jgi:hypothetical protein
MIHKKTNHYETTEIRKTPHSQPENTQPI